MPKDIETEIGKLTISDELAAALVGLAVLDCDGVLAMSTGSLSSGLRDMIGGDHMGRGVRLEFQQEAVSIQVHIIVAYGSSINEVASQVVARVTKAVEDLLELRVNQVRVVVDGVRPEQANESSQTGE